MLRKVLVFTISFVVILSLNAFSSKLIDKIVATVNGTPITMYELKNIAPLYKAKSVNQLLNEVINDTIIEQYAQNVGITVSDDKVEEYLKNIASKNNLTVDEFLEKLKDAGIDLEEYKKGVKLMLYRFTFARRVFLPSVTVTKKDIERYYKLHKDMFENANKVVVLSIISLKDLNTAQTVYKELLNGAKFEDMMKKYSLNKNPEREIPLAALNPYLQNKILSLKKGQFTNIIESDGKYYIVRLLDIKEGGNIDTQIKNILIEKQIDKKLTSWLKMIRARSDIELFLK